MSSDFDMIYDSKKLSDFGFIIGSIDASDSSFTTNDESVITFDTVPIYAGKRMLLTDAKYDTALSANFTILKDPCANDDLEITDSEYSQIMRWLNRQQFLECCFISPSLDKQAFYNASFNIVKNRIGGRVIGLDLTMVTDSPHAHGSKITKTFTISNASTVNEITDTSEVIGYIYPDMVITPKAAGTLTIVNKTTGYSTVIKNCIANEVITIRGKERIITTSNSAHDICSDFNFEFFSIQNSYDNTKTQFTASLACTIEMSYSPIIRSGI